MNTHVRRVVGSDGILSMLVSDQSDRKGANDHIVNALDQDTDSDHVRLQCASWSHKARQLNRERVNGECNECDCLPIATYRSGI